MIERRQFLTATTAFFGATALTALPVQASEDAAVALVKSVQDQILALIRSPGSAMSKEPQFRRIMDENADMRQIAGFALGRYARGMSDAQKARYIEAFKNFVTHTYVKRFDEYQGEKMDIIRTRDGGRSGYLVDTEVRRGSEPALVVGWLISDRSGRPLVADLVVEGVSMNTSQRSEFTSMIDSMGGDLDRFIADLEARARS